MAIVSIIVPVYNVEKYLAQCLDSLIMQTLKNIEIILIDDGSTDNSGLICDEYAAQDSRIKVIHKKNGGASDTRNAGLKSMNGDFVSFVDGDDFVADDYIQTLYNLLITNGGDIACIQFIHYYPDYPEKTLPKQIDKGSMSIVGVTQNGNTVWSSVKLLHFSLNDGTYEECDCGSDENYDNRRHCV
jgi:glycosyltransferase involved in cell wall biosynthesis